MAIEDQVIADCVERLRTAHSRAERAAVVRYYAELYRCSPAHLRRLVKRAGADFGYARRTDAGKRRRADLAEAADVVASVIVRSEGDMPTWRAIEYAKDQKLIRHDLDLSVAYVDRYIRDAGIARAAAKSPAATRRCKWGECGQTLQIDSTNCAQWFFTEPDGSIRRTRRGEVYANKPAKGPAIIRYVAIDPPSGCFRVRYYQTAGESAEVLLDFLHYAMSRSDEPERMPMCGVPRWLVIDKGPGNMSSAALNACDALGIERRAHATGHSWAKGAVEQMMHLWERSFESELRLHPARDMDDLNRRAFEYSCRFCLTRPHGRTQAPRAEFYAAHVGQVVLPPTWEIYVEAATTRRVERTVVGGSLISYDGRQYYVGALEGVRTGDKVGVAKAVLEWDDKTRPVRIYHGDQVVIEPAQIVDAAGNYADDRIYSKRQDAALDAAEEGREVRLAMPLPEEPPSADVAKLPKVKAPEARLIVRPAQPVATQRRTAALLELADRVGRDLTSFELAGLGWGDKVAQNEIDAAADRLSGATAKRDTQDPPATVAAG